MTSSPQCMLLVGPLLYTHSCTAVLTAHSCAQAEVDVGPVNAAGLRGTLAARDFAPGDTIIAVPFNLTVAVGGHNTVASVRTPPLCAGNCCRSTCFFACCARKAGCLAVQRSLWPARWASPPSHGLGPACWGRSWRWRCCGSACSSRAAGPTWRPTGAACRRVPRCTARSWRCRSTPPSCRTPRWRARRPRSASGAACCPGQQICLGAHACVSDRWCCPAIMTVRSQRVG